VIVSPLRIQRASEPAKDQEKMPNIRPQSATSAFAQSAATKLLLIGVNAATGIVTARALAPSGRGELSAMMLWYIFFASSLTLGLPSALTYRLRKHTHQAPEIAGAALLLSLAISSAAAAAGYFALPYLIPQYSPHVLFFARLFLLNTPVAAFFVIGRAAVESSGAFGVSNLSLIGPPTLTLAGLILLGVTHRFTVSNAACCYVAAGFPSLFWMIRAVYQTYRPRIRNLGQSSRLLLSYGLRSYGIDLCGTMSLYVDQALVVRFLKPEMMGTYVVALSLSRLLNAFHTSVVMVLFPKAVSRTPAEVWRLTGKAVRMTTFVTVMCGAVIVLAGPRLLVALYGSEYGEAAGILRILVVEVVISGATQVMSQAFMALARPGVVTALQVIGLLTTIPLMFVLIPRLGIEGAALALLISTCVRFLFVLCSFPLFLKLATPGLLIGRTDLLFMASAAGQLWRKMQPKAAGSNI
jgi:O-antigen/teichoic acid export membrane protein